MSRARDLSELTIYNSETATIGATGDYPTINAALEYYSKRAPVYKKEGIAVTLELQAGFVMSEQVLVRGIDFGWVTITGVDAQTTIANAALTIDFTTADYEFNSFPAFGVSKGGVLPRIGQLFIFDVAGVGGNKHGVMAIGAGSSADVLADCGVVNAGGRGIFASRGSIINASDANASGAGNHGIYAERVSIINAHRANASGASTYGVFASNGAAIDARVVDASGAGDSGIYALNGSTINARDANASGAGGVSFLVFSGSTINAQNSVGNTSISVNTLTSSGIIFR